MDFTYKPSQATGLFGKVVTTMQQAGQEVHDLLMWHKDCVTGCDVKIVTRHP